MRHSHTEEDAADHFQVGWAVLRWMGGACCQGWVRPPMWLCWAQQQQQQQQQACTCHSRLPCRLMDVLQGFAGPANMCSSWALKLSSGPRAPCYNCATAGTQQPSIHQARPWCILHQCLLATDRQTLDFFCPLCLEMQAFMQHYSACLPHLAMALADMHLARGGDDPTFVKSQVGAEASGHASAWAGWWAGTPVQGWLGGVGKPGRIDLGWDITTGAGK